MSLPQEIPGRSPIFRRWPEGLEGRWAAVREFLQRWHGIELGAPEEMSPSLVKADRLARKPLAESVRQWVRLSDQLGQNGWTRVLRDIPGHLAPVRVGGAVKGVALLTAGEGDAHWIVSSKHLSSHADPPVQRYVLDYESEKFVRHGKDAPSVSEWVLTLLLSSLSLRGGVGFSTRDERSVEELAALFSARIDLTECVLLEDPGAIAVVQRSGAIRVHARSDEALADIQRKLPEREDG